MSFFTSDGVEQLALKDYTERAYLDYSMYVINDRALPFIGDGLKPVQRRIIYAMSELGLDAAAKYVKSARTIGDVLGKFHPHGDSACYEAMVLMAQPFSYRYPLVDGQGNWGAPDDPKSFAAMRYTEAKLTKYSRVLLEELGQGTVDYVPNFDGSLDEPARLPAKLPNILLNGGTGIAVGMATDIPPHNLNEVASACIHLLDQPKATLEDILEHIKAPDYPTEAEIITPADELKKLYQTGKGSVRARAIYHLENGEIVITALPYQVSGNKILEQIAAQMQAKKLPMVADLRDESDHENPTRLVVVPRSNRVDCEAIMQHLFASTGLENSYRVNFNMIGINGNPAVKSLLEILVEWLEYRTETVTRRLSHRLSKILARLHILEGMMIAYLNIDEVIRIVREEDKPKAALMSAFGISDLQAESILNIRLRQLAKLEEIKIRGEQDELEKERKGIEKILGSKARMKSLLRKEILAAAKEYGDDRRSPLVERRTAQAFSEMDLVSSDPVTVVLSEKGWIRAAKGHEVNALELNYKSGDGFKTSVQGKSNQSAIFMDSTGRVYTLAAHTLPSARGQGEPLSGRLNIPSGATIEGLLMSDLEDYYLLASDAGYGFVTQLKDMVSKNKAGKVTLTLPPGGKVIAPIAIKDVEKSSIVAISNEGRMLVFPVTALPVMARGKGNKIMNIPAARVSDRLEFLAALKVVSQDQTLVVHSGKRHIKLRYKDLEHYIGERARRGSKLPRGFQRVDSVEIGLK